MTSVATCPCVRWLILPLYCIVIANGQVLKETLEIALQCGGNRWEGNTYTFEPYTFCVLCGTYLVLTYKKDKKKTHWWSIITSISIKRTTTADLTSHHLNVNKTTIYAAGSFGRPGLGCTHTVCWRLNPVMNVCAILKYYCIILPFRLHF